MFSYVSQHFQKFLQELELNPDTRKDGESKAERIARSLFAAYYPNQTFTSTCYAIVGSYGKGTAAEPRTDIDMIFVLPPGDFPRVNALAGNKQSQLLQEVKRSLLVTYPFTDIRGDGPVVKVPFSTYEFEVCPVFRLQDGSFWNAHTKNGGRWGNTNPVSEMSWLKAVDSASLNKATQLVKMLKAWQRECNIDMKSICLEVAAIVFVNQWANRTSGFGYSYHDYMVRDFFAFLLNYVNGTAKPAGIEEWIPLGDSWHSKCQTAHDRAVKACDYEHHDDAFNATSEWQKIFGSQFQIDWANSLFGRSLTAGFGV